MGPYRANSYLANNPLSYNFPTLHQAYFTGIQAKASFLNGDSTVVNSSSNTMRNFNTNYYKVGSATDYTATPSYLTGRISEILVYSGTLTETQTLHRLRATWPPNGTYNHFCQQAILTNLVIHKTFMKNIKYIK